MSGKRSKKWRRAVYGSILSPRVREYVKGHEPKAVPIIRASFYGNPSTRYFEPVPTCICTGLRAAYQRLKKEGLAHA